MVALAAAALSVAACTDANTSSSGTTTTSTTGGPTVTTTGSTSGDASVAWVDKVCGEIADLSKAQPPPPADLASADQQQALRTFNAYITENIDVVNQTINDLVRIGEPPFADAGEFRTALVTGLEALRKAYETTKDEFASMNTNDPQAVQTAVTEAFTSLAAGAEEFNKAMESINADDEIARAAKQAPNCQEFNDGASTTTSRTTGSTATTTS